MGSAWWVVLDGTPRAPNYNLTSGEDNSSDVMDNSSDVMDVSSSLNAPRNEDVPQLVHGHRDDPSNRQD